MMPDLPWVAHRQCLDSDLRHPTGLEAIVIKGSQAHLQVEEWSLLHHNSEDCLREACLN